MKTYDEKIDTEIEQIQNEMETLINNLVKENPDTKASYQDMANAFFIQKLAELQVELDGKSSNLPND
jgi:hypothetical protein